MLKTETIHSLAKVLKMEPQDLEAKIKSEGEEDITLPELEVFTKEEFKTRIKNETKFSYDEGKGAGPEMWVRDKKAELGYDFEGRSIDDFFKVHNEHLKSEFNKPDDEKVKELKKDIERLNQTHQQTIQERDAQLKEYQNKYNQSLIDTQILSIVPNETTIPKEDVITLFKANFQTELSEDGRPIVKKNGEVLKDPTTASERDLKDVFTEFISERKYVKQTSGRGRDNEFGDGGSTVKSISSFEKNWLNKNPDSNVNSPEYRTAYQSWRKENPEVTE